MITADQIPQYLSAIPMMTNDQLIFLYKVSISKDTPTEKKAFAPLAEACQKERKKRGNITQITSKPTSPATKQTIVADSYENE